QAATHIDTHAILAAGNFNLFLRSGDRQATTSVCYGQLWQANDGGLSRSIGCGAWRRAEGGPGGLSTLASLVPGVAPIPGDGPGIGIGTGDNNDFETPDGGASWQSSLGCGDCGDWFGDPLNPYWLMDINRSTIDRFRTIALSRVTFRDNSISGPAGSPAGLP